MDSFLDFSPTLAVILNVGMDHVDYFHSMAQIHDSFLRYARRVGTAGAVLYNADDDETVRAMTSFEGRRHTFGIEHPAEFLATACTLSKEGSAFTLCRNGVELCRIRLPICGMHNVYNALAAAASAVLVGRPCEEIVRALASFTGAGRRMEYKGRLHGAAVYDDYAHHPEEIRATLRGARNMGYRRVLCAYQPHTYSRTAGLFKEFSAAFEDADRVFFADVYAAREENVYGVSMERLAAAVGPKACYCGDAEQVAKALREEAREGDLVLVMGAGDVWHVFPYLGLS